MTPAPANTRLATAFALLSATLMIAHQVGGKATRDAVFLSHYDVTQLPKMVIVAALLSMLAVIVMSRLLARFGPSRVVPLAFLVSAGLFVGSWSLYADHPALAALTLYTQMAVFGAVLISGFWSVVNERFDPHTAKRTIAQVAAAATLGGVLGGFLADRVAAMLDARAMIVVLGALHLACAVAVRGIGRAAAPPPGQPVTMEVESGIGLLFRHRYLTLMGLLMTLVAVLAALVDYAFKAEAARMLADEAALVGLFGRFYAIAGVVTFAVQSLAGPRLLNRFGIGATLATMPVIVIACGLLNIVTLKLWTVVLLRGGQMVVQNSFFRSAFELLYTPLPPMRKRPTKSIIDVASDRLGDVIGGGIVLGLLALVPTLPSLVVIVVALVVAVVTLVVVGHLYRGYVAQLADNLRDGVISIADDEIVDATTRQTLAEASAATERKLLLARIAAQRTARGDTAHALPAHPDTVAPPSGPSTRLAGAISDLTSGDGARVRACLEGDFMDARLAPFVIPMLAVDALADLARTELRFMVPQCIGALTDALLDPDVPLLARQRLPSVLEVSPQPRVVEALLHGLDDAEFNVRYSSARALSRMHGRDGGLHIDTARVFAACEREVAVPRATWQARDIRIDDVPQGEEAVTAEAGRRVDYSLEHVFTLLSLVLDRDALRLSFRAVFSPDRGIRGTALEYLENVLPENIRHGLWPHLGQPVAPRPGTRGDQALLAELRRSLTPPAPR
ncbi:MAG: Npt1/Npt2 family nucleotide transporter [Gammaproteobacteria bacterium]